MTARAVRAAGALAVFVLLVAAAAALIPPAASAADISGAETGSAPIPARPAGQGPDIPAGCDTEIPAARLGPPSDIVVTLDPDTLWRPRGAEVRFTFNSNGGHAPVVRQVWACYRWSEGAEHPVQAVDHTLRPSPLVRSVPNTAGLVEYGAVLPGLSPLGVGWPARLAGTGGVAFTGLYIVPLADLQIVAELQDGRRIAVLLPVGVTSASAAVLVVLLATAATCWALWRTIPDGLRDGVNPVLAVISTSDHVASLSQFQIMLWTFVVGAASVYVMVLSGNLISISSGTLTLLGIAGGTAILGRLPPGGTSARPPPPAAGTPPPRAAGMPPPRAAGATLPPPRWSQLLVSGAGADDDGIDVTRVQMLIFTLVTAAFVSIKVAVSYEIPEIPPNFVLLMGISNGVYIAGRQVPATARGRGADGSGS